MTVYTDETVGCLIYSSSLFCLKAASMKLLWLFLASEVGSPKAVKRQLYSDKGNYDPGRRQAIGNKQYTPWLKELEDRLSTYRHRKPSVRKQRTARSRVFEERCNSSIARKQTISTEVCGIKTLYALCMVSSSDCFCKIIIVSELILPLT